LDFANHPYLCLYSACASLSCFGCLDLALIQLNPNFVNRDLCINRDDWQNPIFTQWVIGLMLPVANTAGMIEHLRLISQATAKDRQALVIVDRAGWHMTKAIRCFRKERTNFTIEQKLDYAKLMVNENYTKFKKQLN
jgi:hypothetical protein